MCTIIISQVRKHIFHNDSKVTGPFDNNSLFENSGLLTSRLLHFCCMQQTPVIISGSWSCLVQVTQICVFRRLPVHIYSAVPVCFVISLSLMDQHKNLWQLLLNVIFTFKEKRKQTKLNHAEQL